MAPLFPTLNAQKIHPLTSVVEGERIFQAQLQNACLLCINGIELSLYNGWVGKYLCGW